MSNLDIFVGPTKTAFQRMTWACWYY